MNLPTARRVEVLAALLLLSGCTRRIPESGIYETRCRTLGVRFEQTAGACVPFSRMNLAVELLGQRCDDDTLVSGLRKLQEASGPERVEAVLRGERIPGSSRHRVVVRYASASPGSCPLAPGAGSPLCEDCKVGKVLVTLSPSTCATEPLMERVHEVATDGLRTCKAEELDAARARVWRAGQFSSVEVLCTRNADDGLQRVRVYAECASDWSQQNVRSSPYLSSPAPGD